MKRYEIKAANSKVLDATTTIDDAHNTAEFYERNEPSYKPCSIRDMITGEYIERRWQQ